VEFRREANSETWHCSLNCSKWPIAECFNILRAEQLPTDFQLCSECAALVHLEKGPSDRFSEQFPGIGFSYKTLIELVPLAAYAIRAPDGAIVWYNSRAADLWGRRPVIGDLDECFCGSYRLYSTDGTYMARSDTPIANALKSGISLHQQEVIVERPDGSRVTVCVHIDPIRDGNGKIMGVVNFFYDVNERNKEEHKLSR